MDGSTPVNTKHLYNICTTAAQRLRRWSNIVQMLYKCLCLLGRIPQHPALTYLRWGPGLGIQMTIHQFKIWYTVDLLLKQ